MQTRLRTLSFAIALALFASLTACRSTEVAEVDAVATPVADTTIAADYTIWQVAPHPESVTIHGAKVYVTQFGAVLEPMTQDGDGFITVYDANGTLLDTLVTGLDAPKGSEVIGDILYVVDVDTLFGFNTSTGAVTFAKPMPGKPQFLNGLASTATGSLYVSATDAGKIWEVVPATGKITEVASLPAVNGVAVDKSSGMLYAVVYPQSPADQPGAYRVDPKDRSAIRIGAYEGVLDGIAVANGQLYTTDWNPDGLGRIVAIDLRTGSSRIIAEDKRFTGPADFDMLGDGLALIPMLMEDRVVAVSLK